MKVSDCPHKPGAPEHTAWIRDVYLPWQTHDPEQLAAAAAGHQAANELWRRLDNPTEQQRAAAATMREVEEATGQRREEELSWAALRAYAEQVKWVSAPDLNAREQAYYDQIIMGRAYLRVPLFSFGTRPTTVIRDETSRAARRTYPSNPHKLGKRTPAPPAAPCHHGNPRNACRDCSMGRR